MSRPIAELQDGVHINLGGFKMEQSKADFIRESIAKAPKEVVPLLDIYAEILTVHDEIQTLGVLLSERINRLEEALTPWYVKLARRIWQYIMSPSH